jgi:hypothetical protein
LAGIACSLIRELPARSRRLSLALLGGAWLALAVVESPWYLVYSPTEVVSRKYPNDRFAMISRLAADLRQRTSPGDTLYQWGFEPELYFLADRRSASRYTIDQFVGAAADPRRAAAELARDIAERRPRFVLVIPQGNTAWPGYLELMNVLVRSYDLEKEIEGARLFRLQGWQKG